MTREPAKWKKSMAGIEVEKNIASFHPIGVTFETIDRLAKNKQTDEIALYMGYSAISHWQKTYRPKVTNSFMIKRLGWTEERFSRAKRNLVNLDLIRNIRVTMSEKGGRVAGWYVEVRHLVEKLEHEEHRNSTPVKNPGGEKNTGVKSDSPSALNCQLSSLNNQNKVQSMSENEFSHSDFSKYSENSEREEILNKANSFDIVSSAKKNVKTALVTRRTDIDFVLEGIRKIVGILDGSKKEQGFMAKNFIDIKAPEILRQVGNLNPTPDEIHSAIFRVFQLATEDDFHRKNCNSIKYVYNKAGSIIVSSQQKGKEVLNL